MSSKNSSGVSVGSISLLVIFLVLCMSIFSVLSLTTAKAGLRLAEKSALSVAGYYSADFACTEKIQQLRDMMDLGAGAAEIADASERLGGRVVQWGDAVHIEFSQQIMPGQELQVELAAADGRLSIIKWRSVDVGPWEPDDSLRVWEGYTQ
ncbi:MAG: hypothetical protein FWD21_02410 [Peptococcaceae bacterium]|nr:hypothetical protein [Peptococcaceae bacterium]